MNIIGSYRILDTKTISLIPVFGICGTLTKTSLNSIDISDDNWERIGNSVFVGPGWEINDSKGSNISV